MKSNGLLKWLMVPMVLLVVLILVKVFSNKPSPAEPPALENQLTAEEMKALGLAGDTPSDTVKPIALSTGICDSINSAKAPSVDTQHTITE